MDRVTALGVYVHFPWCLSKCPYCDFVVYAAPRAAIDHQGYADAVVRELEQRVLALGGAPRALQSIFIGGGTPSLWNPAAITQVLRAITATFGVRPYDIEISLESDPSSLDEEIAIALMGSGVNRLSIGLQSLDARRLRFLGRVHSAEDGRRAMRAAQRAHIPRISADIMYAVAGQTPEEAAEEAREALDLGASHVSAYSLTIEPGTPFGSRARRGRLPLYDDGQMAEAFFAIDEVLTARGLQHYEVSNYAAPGQEARHNIGYWTGRDYLGLGCGAYGTLSEDGGRAVRYRNDPQPARYVERIREGQTPSVDQETLDGETRMRERIMLGLRMRNGFDLQEAARELGVRPLSSSRSEALARLEAHGRVVRRGFQISVPREAWIWVDETAALLF